MIPRGKLDLNFQDIFAGIGYCIADLFSGKNKQFEFPKEPDRLLTLSVRTALDLILTGLNYPPGTEVLVSNINIPDMFNIIRAHQLIPIPLSVRKDTLSIDLDELAAAINPASKMLLLSPLFGGIMDMDAIIKIAKKHQLLVIEDAAQAFMGEYPDHIPSLNDLHPGHPGTDAQLYSFGLIKTNTAISGALIKIKDRDLYLKVRKLNDDLKEQETSVYLKKLFKVLFMKVLTVNSCYTLFYHLISCLGKDFDEVLTGFTRGFPGQDPLKKIRFRPCLANLRLLERKWNNFSPSTIKKRKLLAEDLLAGLPESLKIGRLNKNHSYWVLPIECDDPQHMIQVLRQHGFDATAKASSLVKLAPVNSVYENPSALCLKRIIYLPMDTQMKNSKRRQLHLLLQKEIS